MEMDITAASNGISFWDDSKATVLPQLHADSFTWNPDFHVGETKTYFAIWMMDNSKLFEEERQRFERRMFSIHFLLLKQVNVTESICPRHVPHYERTGRLSVRFHEEKGSSKSYPHLSTERPYPDIYATPSSRLLANGTWREIILV